ncbi:MULTISPECIES: response regulator [unclassified Janibacter]|uniref:response regulator n=1 Tax=unclassified Janibacter TaxID=2649294 RepID=UPI003CFEB888
MSDQPEVRARTTPVRVVLADDHVRHRQLMAMVLGLDGRIDVVGQADDGEGAIEQVLALDPDVVLLDCRMPGIGGIEACSRIRVQAPRTHCLMLTMADDREDRDAALAAGAEAYLFKAADADEIVEAVLRVADGVTAL